jgi:hypothetical protein
MSARLDIWFGGCCGHGGTPDVEKVRWVVMSANPGQRRKLRGEARRAGAATAVRLRYNWRRGRRCRRGGSGPARGVTVAGRCAAARRQPAGIGRWRCRAGPGSRRGSGRSGGRGFRCQGRWVPKSRTQNPPAEWWDPDSSTDGLRTDAQNQPVMGGFGRVAGHRLTARAANRPALWGSGQRCRWCTCR